MRYQIAVLSAMLAIASIATARADMSNSDREFATKAAQAGMAEVAEARVALKNSKRPDVRMFARRMIADHTKANDQLESIAKQQGIELPNAPSDEDLARIKQLSATAGTDFDNAYIQQGIKDHEAAVQLFAQESDSGQNDQLKSFATATLPTLREHDRMVKSLPVHGTAALP
jgi:putative membrane protein